MASPTMLPAVPGANGAYPEKSPVATSRTGNEGLDGLFGGAGGTIDLSKEFTIVENIDNPGSDC